MGGVIRRIVDIGVRPGQTAPHVRRVQMINLIAAGSAFLNLLYNLLLLTIGLSDLWLVFTTNQVTEDVFRRLRGTYRFESRGRIDVKGKGPMETYFLQGHIGASSDG